TMLEIGPGQGALTMPLLERLEQLHVIELDRDLARDLQAIAAQNGKLHVHCTDVLDINLSDIVPVPVRVVGNLPYNISTPVLFHLLQQLSSITEMIFMLQEEVVNRLCTGPGSKIYGRLSVMVQAQCEVEKILHVGAGAFTPPPRVESALVRLVPHKQPRVNKRDYPRFARIVRESFNQRRKTLRNALKAVISEDKIIKAGIDPTVRAEQLSVEQFASLANQLHDN
ncbi:MAG TPA: 16S rRNA (adenine(1518)-N(6)/adenine(1519)-N(6))-dimethyltransferase RsmA, partial [Gammaproteobacteria bacterium]|nr:16S rRNA (adenine(1518)-N(6)/adenine(1519)-N(6))-dimethyltransferase RsmA [Gammaproteobacteria bacterium]